MPLSLAPLLPEIEGLAGYVRTQREPELLERAVALLRSLEAGDLARHLAQARERVPWLVAVPTAEPPGAVFPSPDPPRSYTAVAADGSHIAPDRHGPVRYLVLNVGWVRLRYGTQPAASAGSRGRFLYREEDLNIEGTDGLYYPIEGPRLGVWMAVKELETLAEEAAACEPPVVAFFDGSLIYWHLQNEERGVQDVLLPQVRRALRTFYDHGIPVASFISYPAARDVVNSLRVWLCGHCRRDNECGRCQVCTSDDAAFCFWLRGLMDRQLMAQLLEAGQRSALFLSTSAILKEYVEPDGVDHRVHFFYVHTGAEIARVEVPAWVARDPQHLQLVHAVVVDQCRRGQGYPPVLQEAHEEAVITAADREALRMLVEEVLARSGLGYERSAKDWSKRVRGV